jgi:uncharacterized protein
MLIVALGLLTMLVVGALGFYGALQLTRPPRWGSTDHPDRWGLPHPEIQTLPSRDGLHLAAWWFSDPSATASVIVCHGRGGDKRTSLWVAADLFPTYNVLLLDLRGHGDSGGACSSAGYLERLDVLGAVDWLLERVGHQPIGVLGISMGAAAAIHAAAGSAAVSAVVADSPFARLYSPVREAICARGYPRAVSPVLAWSVCTLASWMGTPRGPWRDPLDVVDRIAPRPLLIIHGEADQMIPVENAHALLEQAGPSAQAWILPEVGHAQAAAIEPAGYSTRVRTFFERALGAPGQPAAHAGASHGDHIGKRELEEVDRR